MQVHDQRRLLDGGRVLGRKRVEKRGVSGLKARLKIAVLERDAVDGCLLHGVMPALERGTDVAAAAIEDEARGGVVAVFARERHKLRHAQAVLYIARTQHATLDLFGETHLGRLERYVCALGQALAVLITGVGGEHRHVAHGGCRVIGAVLLAHQDLAGALVAGTVDIERVLVHVVGAHGTGQVEYDLADPGAKIAQCGDGCVGTRFEFHELLLCAASTKQGRQYRLNMFSLMQNCRMSR